MFTPCALIFLLVQFSLTIRWPKCVCKTCRELLLGQTHTGIDRQAHMSILGLTIGCTLPISVANLSFQQHTHCHCSWLVKSWETKHEISWLFLELYSKFGVKYDKIKKVTNPSLPLFSGSAKENIGYCQHSWTFQHCYEINWQESHTGILFLISLWVKQNIPHSVDWLV